MLQSLMLQSLMSRVVRETAGRGAQLTLLLSATPRTADELLARLRDLGLRGFTACRLTRNRNVMVSFSGTTLRVHEGYLTAPGETLAAIVTFIQGRTRAERRRARRHLLLFPIETAGETRRRRSATHPEDAAFVARLAESHRLYNASHFAGELGPVQVRVSRRMRARLGHYTAASKTGDPPEIAISRRHLRRHGWNEALQTLLHEMVHQWQDERGLALDHGRAFRAKARAVGISPYACRTVAA